MKYSIFDPTGNITALVESPVAAARQSAVAAAVMARHPAVEQVGFVRFSRPDAPFCAELRMAGGEFCGNACMSAAALRALRGGLSCPQTLYLRVSGAAQAVEVRLEKETEKRFSAAVSMPRAREITETAYACDALRAALPVVRMEGITHIVIEEKNALSPLLRETEKAERAVRTLCAALEADCLGLMFLEGEASQARLTPLVFVPGSGTLFWEKSCASGSAAVGMYLASRAASPVALELKQPGGSLRVESDPNTGETWLHGHTRLVNSFDF